MDSLLPLKKAKHAGLLGAKRAGVVGRIMRDRAWYPMLRATRSSAFDHARFVGKDGRFPMDYFLNRGPMQVESICNAPKRIFVLWTGGNTLTPNRQAGLESIRASQSSRVEVILVTPENLHEWEVPEAPIPDVYQHLSYVHRSDYLRSYLMHHHGGGYSDIKPTAADWAPLFDRINTDPDAWVLGYPETASEYVARIESPVGRELHRQYARLVGNCAFICRPGTPLTSAWFDEVSSRLDYYRRALERAPAKDPFGDTGGYPVPWTALQGQVFQPLQLMFNNHVVSEPGIAPTWEAHR